jgi:hypothetical protein
VTLPLVSKCCAAPVRVTSGRDWPAGTYQSVYSSWHVCTACGQPADTIPTEGIDR